MRQRLGEMLIEAGAIDQSQLKSALADQRRWGRPLGRTLVEMRLIREEDLVLVLARQMGLESIDLDKVEIDPHVIELVPAHIARQYNVLPFARALKFLDLAVHDPTNLGVVDELRIRTQLNVRPYLAGPRMIERNIERYYGATRVSDDYEIPITADVTVNNDRGEVSIASVEVRDGLRTYQHRSGAPTSPPLGLVHPDALVPSGRPSRPTQSPSPAPPVTTPSISLRDQEIDALQSRISMLEAMVQRDEQVLRKLLALLIEKNIATREEIIERLG